MNNTRLITQDDIKLLDALYFGGITKPGDFDTAGAAAAAQLASQPLSAVLTAVAAVLSATATAAAQRTALGLGTAAQSATGDFDAAGAAAAAQALGVLLAGRSGGQTVNGGTAASENLILRSTNHATKGQVQSTDDFAITTLGKGLRIKEGSNAKMGTAVLSGGTVTVNTTALTANSRIFLTAQSLGTVAVPSGYCPVNRVPGTSFDILASVITDSSTIAWMIVEPS